MIGLASIFALPKGIPEIGRLVLTALLVGLLCFNLGQCDGARDERARQDAARAEANVEAMTRDQGARDVAAERRVADATDVAAHEEELIDAISEEPDTLPDPVRVRLGCQRLRSSGADPATLPAACGSGR